MTGLQIIFLAKLVLLYTLHCKAEDPLLSLEDRVQMLEDQNVIQAYKYTRSINKLETQLRKLKAVKVPANVADISSKAKERLANMENNMKTFMDKTTEKVDALMKGLVEEKVVNREYMRVVQDLLVNRTSEMKTVNERIITIEEQYKTAKISNSNLMNESYFEMIHDMKKTFRGFEKDLATISRIIGQKPQLGCQPGWFEINRICYRYFDVEKRDWHSAAVKCFELGGTLAGPKDADTMDVLFGKIGDNTWLGGTDEETEGEWKWIGTNEKITYDRWGVGQPNSLGSGQDCLEVFQNTFNDENCMAHNTFLCEKKPDDFELD